MKLPLTVIFVTLIGSLGFSQKFSKTDKYHVTVDDYTLDSIGQVQPINGDTAYIRLLTSNSELEIFRTPISSEFFDGHFLEISFDQKITGIDHVIRLTTSYLACCSDKTSYYFLVSRNNNYMPLPAYSETFCDGPEPYKEYIFDKDLIRLTQFFPNHENELDSAKMIVTYKLENGQLIEK